MEQRPLRLGDIVDDYCPRERRITNHAVVALVDQTIRQTRCGTCEAEHEYKGAREPKRRRKDGSALYDQVLADVTNGAPQPRVVPPVTASEAPPLAAAPETATPAPAAEDSRPDENGGGEVWTTHRPLIRASLPRTAADPPPPRTIPEFTMHQRQQSRFGFRHGGHGGNGQSRGGGSSFGNGHPHGNNRGGGHGQGGGSGRHGGGRPKRAR